MKPCLAVLLCFTLHSAPPSDDEEPSVAFRTGVNLIVVPVVVRDKAGNSVGHLTAGDFELFDNGRRQKITQFAVERSGGQKTASEPPVGLLAEAGRQDSAAIPDRYIAYLFDDLHAGFSDLTRARDAALRHLNESSLSSRVAVYTTSGQNASDFTDDRGRLRTVLGLLRSRVASPSVCPEVNHYVADRIVNRHDRHALGVIASQVQICMPGTPPDMAAVIARTAATQAVYEGEQRTRAALEIIRRLIQRMSLLSGERAIVLVSPGFVAPQLLQERSLLIESATRSGVTISALDARGVYVESTYNAESAALPTPQKIDLDRAAARDQADILAELAEGTGGSFYRNSNDLTEGLRQLTIPPEYRYVLGFVPPDLKPDGRFHTLKVRLKNAKGFSLTARHGYYALDTPQSTLLSRLEVRDLPVTFSLRASKHSIELTVRIDHAGLRFARAGGINSNVLTLRFELFNERGALVQSITREVDLKLRDDVLAGLPREGISIATSLEAQPGKYIVQMIARDRVGNAMTVTRAPAEI